MPRRNEWTDTERRQCRRLHAEGLSDDQIAAALDRTANGVRGVLRQRTPDREGLDNLPGRQAAEFILVGSDSLCQEYMYAVAKDEQQAEALQRFARGAGRVVAIYRRVTHENQ